MSTSLFTLSYTINHSQGLTPITYLTFATRQEALEHATRTFGALDTVGADEYAWSDSSGRSGSLFINEHAEGSAEWCKAEEARLDAAENEVVARAWECHNATVALLQAVLGATVISTVVTK